MSFTESRCRLFVLPLTGLAAIGLVFLVLCGIANAVILFSLDDTMVNNTIVKECDVADITCTASKRMIYLYRNHSPLYFLGWTVALTAIEIVKSLIILYIGHGFYCIYLRHYTMYIVANFPVVASNQDNNNDDDDDETIELDDVYSSSFTARNNHLDKVREKINFDDSTEDDSL